LDKFPLWVFVLLIVRGEWLTGRAPNEYPSPASAKETTQSIRRQLSDVFVDEPCIVVHFKGVLACLINVDAGVYTETLQTKAVAQSARPAKKVYDRYVSKRFVFRCG